MTGHPPDTATENTATTRFLVIGEALIDLVQARVGGSFAAHPGGSPYNVAVTLGRLGGRVAFAGQCGDDAFGDLLTEHGAAAGVSPERWQRLPKPTSLAVAALDEHGRADYRFYFAGTAGLDFGDITDLPATGVLHTGSIASWTPESSSAILRAMRHAATGGQTLVSYDPNVRADLLDDPAATRTLIEECVSLAHVVKVSDDDLAVLYGSEPPERIAARWCAMGAHLVVITRGADGAIAFDANGLLAECPAPRIQIADTVGAGDAFTGGLLFALASSGLAQPQALSQAVRAGDGRLRAALQTAVTVSSITCERPGADPPTLAELAAREDFR